MPEKILLIGGGGHCKSVLDTLLTTKLYDEIAIIDIKENIGKKILSVPIVGDDHDLPQFIEKGYNHAFISLGSIGNPIVRVKLTTLIEELGFEIPNIIDHSAIVSNHTILENGIYIGKNAVINAGSFIHKGAIINSSSIIEHDCIVGEFSHIAPGAVLCGDVKVGARTHVGARSVIKQQINIGSDSMIGMGSSVLADINNNIVAYGNPCREVLQK
jgi:sugar O-acyltransferase (sialic acid O-acetyltransferase NeuD family)